MTVLTADDDRTTHCLFCGAELIYKFKGGALYRCPNGPHTIEEKVAGIARMEETEEDE